MSSKLPQLNGERVIRALERGGWRVTRQSGSHAVLRHSERPGIIVVPRHSQPLPTGTIRAVLKQAGMTADDLRGLL